MNLPRMSPWFARLVFLLILAARAVPAHAAPEPPDPLPGDWLYWKDRPVTFYADGTAHWNVRGGASGTWEYLHNPEVQRHYRIVWKQGASIDNLILAEDGQHAHVINQTSSHAQGTQYDVRRAISNKPADSSAFATVPAASTPPVGAPAASTPSVSVATPAPVDPNDPVLGDWRWFKGRAVTFKPDGTVVARTGPQGVWQSLPNPGAERKYEVNWNRGGSFDTLTFTPGAQTGHVVNRRGGRYDVQRGSSDENMNYFGKPAG